MGDFVRALIDIFQYIWPFRIVRSYQGCVYRRNGLVVSAVRWSPYWFPMTGPGLYVIVPFFCDAEAFDVQPDPLTLPRQTITLRDGRSLTFQALMTMEVDDVVQAIEAVAGYVKSAQEIAAGKIANRLMIATREELDADNRGRLLGGMKQSVNAELGQFGCRCTALSFVQFVFEARTYRIFNDTTTASDVFDS